MELFSRSIAICVTSFALVLVAEQLPISECKRLSSQGDAEALYQMGVRYETGDGVRKDNLRALANYRKAADKGHREACRKLADLYEAGKIVSKDPVLSAKYRAIAVGESGEVAEAKAKTESEVAQVDEIEVALDYIIGRNGKRRDAKAGIRLLYAAAKDKPVARRVFVQRWEKGDLDAGLETIGAEEWDMIVPWFKEQFDSGRHLMGGLILGNEARRKKDYQSAIAYYKTAGQAGLAKAWFYLGKLYDASIGEDGGGGPKSLHNVAKARSAYENCLKLNPNYEDASYYLGLIHMFGEGNNRNYQKALSVFGGLLKKHPDDMWYLLAYGRAGFSMEEEAFFKKWPNVERLIEKKRAGYMSDRERRDYNRAGADYEQMLKRREKYVVYIRRSAQKGCKAAVDFLNINKLNE